MARNRAPNNFQTFYNTDTQARKKVNRNRKNAIYNFYYTRFLEDALSIFVWDNLPSDIPSYILEWGLLSKGQICLWKDIDELGDERYIVSGYHATRWDAYNQPILIDTYSLGYEFEYMHKRLFSDEFEYCFNNITGEPILTTMLFFVDQLTEIETTIRMVTMQLRQPYIFEGNQKTKKTIDQLMNKIEKGYNDWFVISDDYLNNNPLTVHNLYTTEMQKIPDQLYMLKEKYLQEWYNCIGLHTNINNKQAQLTENESIGYNEVGNMRIANMYNMRTDFVQRVNDHFNLDIEVNLINKMFDDATMLNFDYEGDSDIDYKGGESNGNDNRKDTEKP